MLLQQEEDRRRFEEAKKVSDEAKRIAHEEYDRKIKAKSKRLAEAAEAKRIADLEYASRPGFLSRLFGVGAGAPKPPSPSTTMPPRCCWC